MVYSGIVVYCGIWLDHSQKYIHQVNSQSRIKGRDQTHNLEVSSRLPDHESKHIAWLSNLWSKVTPKIIRKTGSRLFFIANRYKRLERFKHEKLRNYGLEQIQQIQIGVKAKNFTLKMKQNALHRVKTSNSVTLK